MQAISKSSYKRELVGGLKLYKQFADENRKNFEEKIQLRGQENACITIRLRNDQNVRLKVIGNDQSNEADVKNN